MFYENSLEMSPRKRQEQQQDRNAEMQSGYRISSSEICLSVKRARIGNK